MGSSAQAYYEMIEEYGSFENYQEANGVYDKQYSEIHTKVLTMMKDFQTMSFKEFIEKYYIYEYSKGDCDVREYVMGNVTGPEYFKKKEQSQRARYRYR
jgi:hypothetical protein